MTRYEKQLVWQIAMRASQLTLQMNNVIINPAFFNSLVQVCHNEVCPLRLQELLEADDGNFAHDVAGIYAHLDVLDGSFREGFTPRYSK